MDKIIQYLHLIFFFLFKKLIAYDTKKNGKDILSCRRPKIFELPKVSGLDKYVKKTPKITFSLRQRGVRIIKLLHWIWLLFSPNFVKVRQKNTKNRDKTFYWSSFPNLSNFCFSDYLINTLILVQLWARPFKSFVILPAREPLYSPTPLYR